MARATVDKCRVQAATVLLQRVVCPSRARANKHDVVFQSLVAIARRELEPEQQSQSALTADMGGCAIRSTSRKGRCAIWELLSATECPPLTRACTMSSLLALPHNLHTTPSSMNHERSRLHGKAGKAIDIVTLSMFWKHASSNARETIQSVAAPSTGLVWSDCSRDEPSGWLQDHHFQLTLLNRLSLPRVTLGSICALAPHTGAHKGQLCAMPLDSFGRHSHGACRAAGARTRVHHAIRQCVASLCRKAGTRRRSRDP